MENKFYATTAIPYVNGKPHLGHALEFVQTDAVARYHRLIGDQVFVTSGSDENGLKIFRAAQEQKLDTQTLCNQNTRLFKQLAEKLSFSFDSWRRGTDQKLHWPGVAKLWETSQKAGDIYKKKYRGLYCVGCEDFYLPKDLVNGKCPEHLKKPEIIEEENYFFRLSKYQPQLRDQITSGKLIIKPQPRKNEALALINGTLRDFSISRSEGRSQGWGIPVPHDPSQVIYTWFDALAIYLTAIGFGYDRKLWQRWWPADIHFIGKGINRFHTIYWPAMLLSARLPLPKQIFIHGYITSGGQKIGKSLGNAVDPLEIINQSGTDALRYYLLREIHPFKDGDFTSTRFEQLYSADLANGLGNLVQRLSTLAQKHQIQIKPLPKTFLELINLHPEYRKNFEAIRFNQTLEYIWDIIRSTDRFINKNKLWKLQGSQLKTKLNQAIGQLQEIGSLLQPFLPTAAGKINTIFQGPEVKAPPPLFPRLN